ncbi:BZ3500_MvSof-1268-A1-R1_Chr9g10891 [Microbotryum saponariae]|uniref:BZ3500_MvSof-1268-A1-R1_Chr9g10891 protein n=1 Tax=Microbotryum saponariae TaxID=289078 RepID=A0A2X0MFB2_9BASI|nr:BZ3501_MvSof-1269-A2-R1_Chr9g10639 [Microbotryum saponariae]SDA00871.1 BZ3500_MvSof-1268-A1-R1_Chr9g10891 [Microbotryum saponariae]
MAKSEADTLAFLVCRQGFLLHVPLDPWSTLIYSRDSDWILNLPPEFCHRRILVDMSIPDSTQNPANKLRIAPRRASARPQCSLLCLIDTMVLGWDGEELIIAGILAGGDYIPGGLPSVAFNKAFDTYKECLSRKFWEGQELGVVLGRFRAIKKVEKLSDTFVKAIEELRNNMPAIFALLEMDEGDPQRCAPSRDITVGASLAVTVGRKSCLRSAVEQAGWPPRMIGAREQAVLP